MPETINTVKHPHRAKNISKQTAGAGTGALVAVVVGWAAEQFGVSMPAEVSFAAGSLIGSFITEVHAYLQRDEVND